MGSNFRNLLYSIKSSSLKYFFSEMSVQALQNVMKVHYKVLHFFSERAGQCVKFVCGSKMFAVPTGLHKLMIWFRNIRRWWPTTRIWMFNHRRNYRGAKANNSKLMPIMVTGVRRRSIRSRKLGWKASGHRKFCRAKRSGKKCFLRFAMVNWQFCVRNFGISRVPSAAKGL